jgi:bifunctional DNA-binding transcriptional regulator/antitoxin component of YhaV-PrlF toxin-antitoxin module
MAAASLAGVIDKEIVLAKVRNMSKVTSKLQVTLPRALAKQLGIKPGDDIAWEIAGEVMRIVPSARKVRSNSPDDASARLRLFDQATRRQRHREKSRKRELMIGGKGGRGWTREELYTRGSAR